MKKTRIFSVITLALILCCVPLTIVSGIYDSSYNNVAIPLSNYPATQENGWNRPPATAFYNTDYNGVGQCDGFARMVHDTFWHMNWSNWLPHYWNPTHGDYYGELRFPDDFPIHLNNASDVESFFRSINRGAVVRLLSYNKKDDSNCAEYGSHSIFFDGIDSSGTGFYAYECNMDGMNGIHYQHYRFDEFYSFNQYNRYVQVIYYVDHTLSSQKTPYSTAYHKAECNNCDGYLLQSHTGSTTYAHYDVNQHKATISCCGYVYYEAHTYNAGLRCTKCQYLKGSSINKLDPELETG